MNLHVNESTTIDEVADFVGARLDTPIRFGDVIVYNFRNDDPDASALLEWAQTAEDGVYVIPFQVTGVWPAMVALMPREVAEARLLAYRHSHEVFADHANLLAEVGAVEVSPDG